MDIRQIRTIIFMFFSKVRAIVKAMFSLPYFKTYMVLSIALTLIFIVLTFPYGEVIISRLKGMEGKSLKSIDIEDLDISLIGTSSAENVTIVPKWGDELTIQSVILDGNINPYSLLMSHDFNGSVSLKNTAYHSDRVDLNSSINCNYDLTLQPGGSGINKGTIKVIMEKTALKITEIELPSALAGMKLTLPPMKFSSVIMNFVIQNDTVSIQQMKVSGPDLQGSITGTINLSKIFTNSKINVAISIDSDSAVLENYRDMLGSYTNADGDIVLNLEGTLSRPRFMKKNSPSLMETDED